MVEGWHAVPVSGVENAAYYYSTYNAPDASEVSSGKKVMVLGGGRTASARESSSTTAASTPRSPARRGRRVDHGQLQPGDRLDDYDTSNNSTSSP